MPKAAFEIRAADLPVLRSWISSPTIKAGLVKRARIVLLAGEGVGTSEICRRVGVTKPTVIQWRTRYLEGGLAALDDRPRSGRPRVVDEQAVLASTLEPPPEELGITHWSSRLLAQRLGTSNVTVAKVWRKFGLRPSRRGTFTFSTDPELEAKIHDVVGLYLHPPENTVVLCVDEWEAQASGRTASTPPPRPGLPERAIPNHVRDGGSATTTATTTTTLFAALNVARGEVRGECHLRPRHRELLHFLIAVATANPRARLCVICDNYSVRRRANVTDWLARNSRITLHFTTPPASWLNMVEVFFGIIGWGANHRHALASDLGAAIRRFIEGGSNDRRRPFVWTRTADVSRRTSPRDQR